MNSSVMPRFGMLVNLPTVLPAGADSAPMGRGDGGGGRGRGYGGYGGRSDSRPGERRDWDSRPDRPERGERGGAQHTVN